METINIQQALGQIDDILEKAFLGEEIIIKKNDQQMIKISSTTTPSERPPLFGSDKDKIQIADNFDEPVTDWNFPVIDAEQVQKNQAAINLLDSWLDEDEDASEHQETWDSLKKAMDEDRLSDRPLFP